MHRTLRTHIIIFADVYGFEFYIQMVDLCDILTRAG